MVNRVKRILGLVLTLALVLPALSPVVVWAVESEVEVENHTSAQAQKLVSGLTIDDVDEPRVGEPLDDTAVVRTAEGDTWEIPVLWISDSLELATEAQEGSTYLPALAFFVPQDYALSGGDFTVRLSESLTKLFGGKEIISVYDASTGITYILPASLRSFFVGGQQTDAQVTPSGESTIAPATEAAGTAEEPSTEAGPSLIDIYCAQTARDALTDEDLEYLINLVLTKLQPQAVELLLEKFPAFRAAADQGSIGREIGMYIYFEKGDSDGVKEHKSPGADALAFVYGDAFQDGDDVKYGYMVAIDALSLVQKDKDGNPIRNPSTGKYILLRDGETMRTFENTIVHEHFHALMDDYNRTGMVGATDIRNALTDENNNFPTKELGDLYARIHYPQWFIEGTASSVENDYSFRHDVFTLFRADPAIAGGFDVERGAYGRRLLDNYVNGMSGDVSAYFDLSFSSGYDADGREIDSSNSRYVSGYLAVLYLGELAARQDESLGTSISTSDDGLYISSEKIRLGLNAILERMHNGETLDDVINSISPVDEDGKKLYADAGDFESKFIKGVGKESEDGTFTYYGDNGNLASYEFVSTFLDYMYDLENQEGRQFLPNGSILFDFEEDYNTPLDNEKDSSSDILQIVESNRLVESTVPNEVALAGGGKSNGDVPANATNETVSGEGLAAAGEELELVTDVQLVEDDGAENDVVADVVDVEQGEAIAPVVEETVQDVEAPVSEAEATPEEDVVASAADPAEELEVLDNAA